MVNSKSDAQVLGIVTRSGKTRGDHLKEVELEIVGEKEPEIEQLNVKKKLVVELKKETPKSQRECEKEPIMIYEKVVEDDN